MKNWLDVWCSHGHTLFFVRSEESNRVERLCISLRHFRSHSDHLVLPRSYLRRSRKWRQSLFNPDWKLLANANIWKDAATQVFYTLSLGFGALIAVASYMPLHNKVLRDAYTVVFINCGASLFAGILVLSILGYRELHATDVSATELGTIDNQQVGSGPGLAFMTFSDAILLMDVLPLWAILFFFMLILLGIDMILFLVSGPGFYVFQMLDDYSVTIPLLVIGLFQCIGVAWVYGNDRFADDIEFMTGKQPGVEFTKYDKKPRM
ncbi:hypothetical protein OS493_033570 [Desmophyllum pertusum]|uniref:Uncharacterized protein n=1 Tax=Desmophyllum pertusum TaxID=174260 RepID=A0A9W9YVP0_9CNID|nr:hypothetical protein OS493_033570 [Desmophyllum pertusum]